MKVINNFETNNNLHAVNVDVLGTTDKQVKTRTIQGDVVDIKSFGKKKEVYVNECLLKTYNTPKVLQNIKPDDLEQLMQNLYLTTSNLSDGEIKLNAHFLLKGGMKKQEGLGELKDNDSRLGQEEVAEVMKNIKVGHEKITQLGEDVVLILGKTGHGKSTLINYLHGAKLVGYDDNGEMKIKAVTNAIAEIGGSTVSETKLPARCEAKGFIFWDCPGFEDNRGADQDIINSFFITHIVKSSTNVRICAVLKHDATKGKANDLIDFAEQIDRLFARKQEVYSKSLSIVITHVPLDQNPKNIQARLIKMVNESPTIKNKDALMYAIENRFNVFRQLKEDEIMSKEHGYKEICDKVKDTIPVKVSDELKVQPSVSPKAALAAIALYQDLNDTIKADLRDVTNSILRQYDDLVLNSSASKERLQEAFGALDKAYNDLPSVITVDQLGVIFRSGDKYFNEYADFEKKSEQFTVEGISLEGVPLAERLNAAKFLENIVLDYARFKPVNLYELLKAPMAEVKNKIAIKLEGKVSEEELARQNNDRVIADAEFETAEEQWSTGKKVGVTVGTGVVGGAVGAGIVWGTMETGALFGSAGGPLGTAIGAGVGLVIGGLISWLA